MNQKEKSYESVKVTYKVIDREFATQQEAEGYARFMTNPISSKIWISCMVSWKGESFCMKSYTL